MKSLHHRQGHIRLEQRDAHFTQGFADGLLIQAAFATNFLQSARTGDHLNWKTCRTPVHWVGYYSGREHSMDRLQAMHDLFSLSAAALLPSVAAAMLYRTLVRSTEASRMPAGWLAVLGVLLHSIAQYQHWASDGPIEVSLLNVMSLSALVVTTILVLSTALRQSLFDAGLIALPLAAWLLLIEWAVPAPGSLFDESSTGASACT